MALIERWLSDHIIEVPLYSIHAQYLFSFGLLKIQHLGAKCRRKLILSMEFMTSRSTKKHENEVVAQSSKNKPARIFFSNSYNVTQTC